MESKTSGRGESKKRKKSARKHLTQRKRKFRCQSKEDASRSETEDTNNHVLPENWPKIGDGRNCKLEDGVHGLVQVTMSLLVETDFNLTVFAARKRVPESSNVLTFHCSNEQDVVAAIEAINKATLCPGNPDEKFVSLCKKKGGSIRGEKGTGDAVAVVEDIAVEGQDGEQYSSTVRGTDCSVLCLKPGPHPVRCKACQSYRSSLRSMVNRQSRQESSSRTSATSHTRYIDLTSDEKDVRLKNLHTALKRSGKKVGLKTKVSGLISKEAMSFQDEDAADVSVR